MRRINWRSFCNRDGQNLFTNTTKELSLVQSFGFKKETMSPGRMMSSDSIFAAEFSAVGGELDARVGTLS